jgi:hypothetical protein
VTAVCLTSILLFDSKTCIFDICLLCPLSTLADLNSTLINDCSYNKCRYTGLLRACHANHAQAQMVGTHKVRKTQPLTTCHPTARNAWVVCMASRRSSHKTMSNKCRGYTRVPMSNTSLLCNPVSVSGTLRLLVATEGEEIASKYLNQSNGPPLVFDETSQLFLSLHHSKDTALTVPNMHRYLLMRWIHTQKSSWLGWPVCVTADPESSSFRLGWLYRIGSPNSLSSKPDVIADLVWSRWS